MYTDRQIIFLIKRFDRDLNLIEKYLNDLCSDLTVEGLAKKYRTNNVQIQRDRNHFVEKQISNKLLKKLKNLL